MSLRRSGGPWIGLLCVALVAGACSGDAEPSGAGADDSLGEIEDVKENWPHCAEYGALQAAIVELDAAYEALPLAEEALEDARDEYLRVADGSDRVAIADAESALESAGEAADAAQADVVTAHELFLLAQSRAQAAAEDAIADTALDDDTRYAAQAASDAFAAALDAAHSAARGMPLPERRSEAYGEAAEAATEAALALSEAQRAVALAQVDNAAQRVEQATAVYEVELAAISVQDAAVRDAEVIFGAAIDEVSRVVAVVESEFAERFETRRADELAAFEDRLFRLGLIVRLAGGDNPVRAGEVVGYDFALKDASDHYVAAGGARHWGDRIGRPAAYNTAWDADFASYGALSRRLHMLADQVGLQTEVLASFESVIEARQRAWADAGQLDWAETVDSIIRGEYADFADAALAYALNNQDAYDQMVYEQLVRYARTTAADMVPVGESVSAADAEEAAWSADSSVMAAFQTAALALDAERTRAISENRLNNRGTPTLDNIAWRGFKGALDALAAAAQQKITEVRVESAEIGQSSDTEMQSLVESDPRVAAARQAASDADTALTSELQSLSDLRQRASSPHNELLSAEAELQRARADSEASRPPYERAVLAAWLAVGEAAGCR